MEMYDDHYNILVVVGEWLVGKTSIISRFVKDTFCLDNHEAFCKYILYIMTLICIGTVYI